MRQPTPKAGARKFNRATHTRLEVTIVDKEVLARWRAAPFQRPLRVNFKVLGVAESIKVEGGVIPGMLTIGILESIEYVLDGQHRLEALKLSGCKEGIANVCFKTFENMADMGEEFVDLNSHLVQFRPDDILRGLEGSSDALTLLRKQCPFVGYDMIRRNERAPIVGMSQVLRCWTGSQPETPVTGGLSAAAIAHTFTTDEAEVLIGFLQTAMKAWGRDSAYSRLWRGLNITLCMWLYRRTVISQYSARTPKFTREQFKQCLMSLSTDEDYMDWLLGRNLNDRDRSPAYERIKKLFTKRMREELDKRVYLPDPPWVHG